MINDLSGFSIENSERFVNPASIPSKKVISIYRDDPRNNPDYIANSTFTINIIDGDNPINNLDTGVNRVLTGEASNPEQHILENRKVDSFNVSTQVSELATEASLGSPANLYINPQSWQLEDYSSAGDGSIRWVASLYFDDVIGASEYEYTLNARAS
jgi:hypothetical protein